MPIWQKNRLVRGEIALYSTQNKKHTYDSGWYAFLFWVTWFTTLPLENRFSVIPRSFLLHQNQHQLQ